MNEPGSAEQGRHRDVYGDLVAGLLDARDDPASDRFDAELQRGLAAGDLSPDLARRLRFWQRAAVRLLVDHVRGVLPVALGALEASRREADAAVTQLAATLDDQQEAAEPEPDRTVDLTASEDAEPPIDDTPEPASASAGAAPTTLESGRSRLIVADLVATRPDVRIEWH